MAVENKTRSQMDKRWTWNLNHMIESDAKFEEMFEEAKAFVFQCEKWKGIVADNAKKAIQDYFALSYKVEKLFVFASMKSHEDCDDSFYQGLVARAQNLMMSATSAMSFVKPELLAMQKDAFDALIKNPEMEDYSVFLTDLLNDRPHTLSYEQEQIMALAGDALNTPDSAYSMLSNIELPFPTVKNEEGESVRLSNAKYGTLIRSKNQEIRKAAYEGKFGTYRDFSSTIATLYAGSVKGDVFNAKVRHFDSALHFALHPDSIPQAVYDNLIEAMHDAIPSLNRYMALRKKALKLDTLHMYDLYVPIVEDVKMDLSYEEAYALILKALAPLGEEYINTLKEAYTNQWIDVYENKAKRSGAYSWGFYDTHPYVLLNYEKGLDGASTCAHELGHAMHSYYSDKTQPYGKAGYSLFVAEVASTCNEVLLAKYLMAQHKDDKKMMAFLLNNLLESFRTTVFRQTLFAEFEKIAHEMAEKGEPLTKESLCATYNEINLRYYGKSCEMDEYIAYEWLRIPHFYDAFYVYKYATGFSAAVAIANRILTEGESAVKDYMKFLSAGGSVTPIEALKYAGVDMSKPDPIKTALDVFAKTVEELEELLL